MESEWTTPRVRAVADSADGLLAQIASVGRNAPCAAKHWRFTPPEGGAPPLSTVLRAVEQGTDGVVPLEEASSDDAEILLFVVGDDARPRTLAEKRAYPYVAVAATSDAVVLSALSFRELRTTPRPDRKRMWMQGAALVLAVCAMGIVVLEASFDGLSGASLAKAAANNVGMMGLAVLGGIGLFRKAKTLPPPPSPSTQKDAEDLALRVRDELLLDGWRDASLSP